MKSYTKALIFSMIACSILYGLGHYGHSEAHIQKRIATAQHHLDQSYHHAIDILASDSLVDRIGEEFKKNKYVYYVHQGDSLRYWSEETFRLSALTSVDKGQFVTQENVTYYFRSFQKEGTSHIIGLPVYFVSQEETEVALLQGAIFSPDRAISHFVKIDPGYPAWMQWSMVLFYMLSVGSGVYGLLMWSRRLMAEQYLLLGLFVFAVGIFLIRMVSLASSRLLSWPAVVFFDDAVRPSLFSPTLGDLLINIGLLCVLIWFIRSYIRPQYFNKIWANGFALGLMNYWLVYLSAFLMVHIFRQLVMNSGLSFDFEYIFYLDFRSVLALSGILILAIALFILDLHLLRIIRHLGLTSQKRLLANGLALAALVPLTFLLPAQLPFLLLLGLGGYLTLLDLFIDHIRPHAAWYLTWTITGSILISSLLYQFHIDKELDQRVTIAQALKQELIAADIAPGHSETFLRRQLSRKETNSAYLALYDLRYIQAPSTPLISSDSGLHTIYTEINGDSGFYLTKKSNQLFKAFSFFSYVFILFNLILVGFALINRKVRWFSFSLFRFFPSRVTLRYRIQVSMLVMSLCSFLLIALVIILYVKKNAWEWQKDASLLHTGSLSLPELLRSAGTNHELYKIYDDQGRLLPDQVDRMPYADWAALHSSDDPVTLTYNTLHHEDGRLFFIKKNDTAVDLQNKRKLNDFLGALLNVYVFLLIVIVLISMIVANSIARPLTVLSTKLKQIKIGGSNQRLEWDHQDELGGLIRNYNEMIQELDRSTRMLALTERETAWREMAKQVAHEIKNPLTPMKLITQHLQNSIHRAQPEEIPPLVKRVTQTLIEQIDNLSKIASEFSNFAKLPAPENEKLVLNEVVTSTHDLFRKREDMDIHLRVPIDEIYVFADKNHIIRVLTNLIKNAIQAIPLGRRGRIEILLYKQDEKAIVKIADNGCGIPDSMKDKVFYPNFTTKNSGTGLGLAIVRDIIDSCNGHIYFLTYENKGTEFYIELPLMHMADNFKEERRVSL